MSTPISPTILHQLADSVDGFLDGPTTELVDAHALAISGLLDEALTKAFQSFDSVPYKVTSFWPKNEGLGLTVGRTDYEGHIRESHDIHLTWDELLD